MQNMLQINLQHIKANNWTVWDQDPQCGWNMNYYIYIHFGLTITLSLLSSNPHQDFTAQYIFITMQLEQYFWSIPTINIWTQ